MSKNNQTSSAKTIAYCALLAAMSIVLARVVGIPIMMDVRLSLEAIPIMLAGFFFGPLAGGLVGFVADFIGSMMSFGFTWFLCFPPIMIGVATGLFRRYLAGKKSLGRWLLVQVPMFAFAYVFWQGFTLTCAYGGDGAFWENYLARIGMRSIQFSITVLVDVILIQLLLQTKIFRQMGLTAPKKREEEGFQS